MYIRRPSFSSRRCTDLEQSSATYHNYSVTSCLLLSLQDILLQTLLPVITVVVPVKWHLPKPLICTGYGYTTKWCVVVVQFKIIESTTNRKPLCDFLLVFYYNYTVSQKKVRQMMFDNNFDKCGPIFKILSPGDCKKIFYVHITKISILPAICCYTTLWTSKTQNVTKFSCWTWQLICLTKI